MTNSTTTTEKPQQKKTTVPRAIIHKKILDAAESRPNESMETIAKDVNGVSLSMVEQVLKKYGDPATSDTDSDTDSEDENECGESGNNSGSVDIETSSKIKNSDTEETMNESTEETDSGSGKVDETAGNDEFGADTETSENGGRKGPKARAAESSKNERGTQDPSFTTSDLTEKQLETLREIHNRPNATQAELGDSLGVTGATINQRVNAIDGFVWQNRRELVDALFEKEDPPADENAATKPVEADQNPDLGSDVRSDTVGSIDSIEDVATISGPEGGDANEGHQRTADSVVRSQFNSDTGSIDRSNPDEEYESRDGPSTGASQNATESLEELENQITALMSHVETLMGRFTEHSSSRTDPELMQKIVHACLTAEHISEEEELRIVKFLLTTDPHSE